MHRCLLEQEDARQECDGWKHIEWKDRKIECSISSKELRDKGVVALAGCMGDLVLERAAYSMQDLTEKPNLPNKWS